MSSILADPIAPSYMRPNAGRGGWVGCGISANEYSCAHGALINLGDLIPYLTYSLSSSLLPVALRMVPHGLKPTVRFEPGTFFGTGMRPNNVAKSQPLVQHFYYNKF